MQKKIFTSPRGSFISYYSPYMVASGHGMATAVTERTPHDETIVHWQPAMFTFRGSDSVILEAWCK